MRELRRSNLGAVALFAVAMAYVESAVVVYLRRAYGITDLTTSLARFEPRVAAIEVGREAATLVMLAAVGWMAGRSWQARWGYALVAFGVWDVAYYLWLRLFIGWPQSPLTPDLLFLIPLPWWGPVLAPVLIAVLMVIGGSRAVQLAERGWRVRLDRWDVWLLALGTVLALVAFMWDGLMTLMAHPSQVAQVKPGAFLWPVYLASLALAGVAVYRGLFRTAANLPSRRPDRPRAADQQFVQPGADTDE